MKQTGLSFIELIISITIFAIVIVAVYGVFNMGIKTWKRTQRERPLQEVRLTFLKMQKELKQALFFSEIDFKGDSSKMIFPIVVSKGETKQVYIVTYMVDKGESGNLRITRKERLYSENKDIGEKTREMVSSMKSIRFEYGSRPTGLSGNFRWQDMWDGERHNSLPSAVRVSLKPDGVDEIYAKVIFLKQQDLNIQ